MSPMTGAIVLFAALWLMIGFGAFRLFRWLIELDRQSRDGEAPIERGL